MKKNWCITCCKHIFPTEGSAMHTIAFLAYGGLILRTYRCPVGEGYHLTTKEIIFGRKKTPDYQIGGWRVKRMKNGKVKHYRK